MITYKDYIKRMEDKGYIYKNNSPILIDESNPIIKTFTVKKGSIGKILELQCPNNSVISACGKTHEEGCEKLYFCDIKCFNDNNDEPFQDLHYSTQLQDKHAVAEIITTKILKKEPDKNHTKVKEWSEFVNPILKMIGSDDPHEHVMWFGVYKLFRTDFLNTSFNLYENQKMILYITNPDIDITKVKFRMKIDIFEHNEIHL